MRVFQCCLCSLPLRLPLLPPVKCSLHRCCGGMRGTHAVTIHALHHLLDLRGNMQHLCAVCWPLRVLLQPRSQRLDTGPIPWAPLLQLHRPGSQAQPEHFDKLIHHLGLQRVRCLASFFSSRPPDMMSCLYSSKRLSRHCSWCLQSPSCRRVVGMSRATAHITLVASSEGRAPMRSPNCSTERKSLACLHGSTDLRWQQESH